MKFRFFIFFLVILFSDFKGQDKCESEFMDDTLTVPDLNKTLRGKSLETTLKNLSVVKIFQSNDPKDDMLYLRIMVTKNFYFDKVDILELQSGKKSYWVKPATKQHKITKTQGLFVVAVSKNYIITLKDNGMTGLVFAGAETRFTRKDANQIKKISRCFYEIIYRKKDNYHTL
jgi:hypothetical protein